MVANVPRDELAKWAEVLNASGDYKVLRHLGSPESVPREPKADEKIAVIVDTETTGLDVRANEVIELGMLAFTYSLEGNVRDVIGTFDELREPIGGLPSEITTITGLTPSDLQGREIDVQRMESFLEPADLVIAHNAAFDRPFCEALSPAFGSKPWACSATEISWRALGFDGVKLSYLLTQCGFFYSAHRALDDSFALFRVLSHPLPDALTPFMHLLESARKPTFRIRFPAPFDVRDVLRSKGYRWNADDDPNRRHWYLDVPEERVSGEIDFLRSIKKIDQRTVVVDRFSALNRYRPTAS